MTTTTLHQSHVYRLYPTPEQASVLSAWVGAVRVVYNLALQQRRIWSRPGRRITYYMQANELPALRAEVDWIKAVPSQPLQQALKDLDQSFQRFFDGVSNFPTNRVLGKNDSMRFPTPAHCPIQRLGRRVGSIRIPKLGMVRFRWDKAVPGKVRNITIRRHAGCWYASVMYHRDIPTPAPSTLPSVGVDRGVRHLAALSTGVLMSPRSAGKAAARRLRRAQRRLARKVKGSNRYQQALLRVQRIHARIARMRKDHAHKLTHYLAKNHGVVVLEKLNIQQMTRSAAGTSAEPGTKVAQKSGLNRSILDRGWGMVEVYLGYKMHAMGGQVARVPAPYTSQRCAACGHVDKASRAADRFRCTACGHQAHADINAAINIHHRWTESLNQQKSMPAGHAGDARGGNALAGP